MTTATFWLHKTSMAAAVSVELQHPVSAAALQDLNLLPHVRIKQPVQFNKAFLVSFKDTSNQTGTNPNGSFCK